MVMVYRFSSDNFPSDELNPPVDDSPANDDQRSRPRTGPIEKIADIAFDTLRKYEDELPGKPSNDASDRSE